MKPQFDETLIEVWRQTLIENANALSKGMSVILSGRFPSVACDK